MALHIRKAQIKDIPEIMRIYDAARGFMRASGNMNQWINGYPKQELVEQDIQNGVSYVCCDGEELYAVFAFIVGVDPTYLEIDGAWPNDDPYGTIHRIGSDGRIKGIFPFCLDFCKKNIGTIRIDTHADNAPMHHILQKNGFSRCGIITIADGSLRTAYCS